MLKREQCFQQPRDMPSHKLRKPGHVVEFEELQTGHQSVFPFDSCEKKIRTARLKKTIGDVNSSRPTEMEASGTVNSLTRAERLFKLNL